MRWRHWQEECNQRLEQGDFVKDENLTTICKVSPCIPVNQLSNYYDDIYSFPQSPIYIFHFKIFFKQGKQVETYSSNHHKILRKQP